MDEGGGRVRVEVVEVVVVVVVVVVAVVVVVRGGALLKIARCNCQQC